MKTAGSLDDIKTRSEIKVICVAEDDLSLDIFLQITVIDAFYRADCADWHEYRCLDLSVVGRDDTATGG